jgi:hypothetical protein
MTDQLITAQIPISDRRMITRRQLRMTRIAADLAETRS